KVICPAALKMDDHTKRRERADKEFCIGNRVRESGTAERRKRIHFVAETVRPVCGGPTCGEAVALVTCRRRQFERGAVLQFIAADIQAAPKKRVTSSVHEPATC